MKTQEFQWPQAKEKIDSRNSEMISILDSIAAQSHTLRAYEAHYFFGESVLEKGKVNIGELENQEFAFGLIISGGLELFIEQEPAKILTLAMLKPGNIIFLQESIRPFIFPFNVQNIIAGARSLFLLPKIGNSDRYWRLARRNKIPLDMPKNLLDQWSTFSALASSLKPDWQVSILLFPECWLKQTNSSLLKEYLQKQKSYDHQFHSSKLELDRIVNKFIAQRKDLYSGQMLKNLLAIASGKLPGFVIAEDETFGPIKMIKQAFKNDYGLKSPDLMHPDYLHSGAECFYSPEFLNNLDHNLEFDHVPSGLNIIQDTQKLYEQFLHLCNQEAGLESFAQYLQTKFEFFHSFGKGKREAQAIKSQEMKLSPQMPFLRKGFIAINRVA